MLLKEKNHIAITRKPAKKYDALAPPLKKMTPSYDPQQWDLRTTPRQPWQPDIPCHRGNRGNYGNRIRGKRGNWIRDNRDKRGHRYCASQTKVGHFFTRVGHFSGPPEEVTDLAKCRLVFVVVVW